MKDNLIKISSILGVLFIAFIFVSVNVINTYAVVDNQSPIERLDSQDTQNTRDINNIDNARADVLPAYKTYTAGAVSVRVDPATNFNIYNSGASFVSWGQMSGTGNVILSVDIFGNGANFRNNTMKIAFRSGNVNNAIKLLNVGIYASDVLYPDPNTITFFDCDPAIAQFDFFSGNEYFIPFETSQITIEFTFVLNSNTYAEFSFNDFLVSFYSNIQFQDAYDLGYQDAYNTYYNSRYNDGYSAGFNAGANNQYSFFTLISAAIDVPLNAGLNLLNFDFLGFNMRDFFLSLFTVALIITVLRFALGRR